MKLTIETIKSENLLLFEVISGSRAFGLHTETSDTDIRGVFYLPKGKFYGLEYIPQVNNESNDIVYYELGRFIELLLKNNPNILEMLASPDDCILYKHVIMEQIQVSDFLSKLCKDTFAGYAITQIKKARGLNKKMVNPVPEERKSILDFCFILDGYQSVELHQWLKQHNYAQENCGLVKIAHSKGMYALFYSTENGYKGIMVKSTANEVSLTSIPQGQSVCAYLYFNQDGYSAYCKGYKEYWEWVEMRSDERYRVNKEHGQNYDAKNMMHTIRLLQTARCIFAQSRLQVRVSNREELLAIKAGGHSYDDLLEMSDNIIDDIEQHYAVSELKAMPDKEFAGNLLIKIRCQLYA